MKMTSLLKVVLVVGVIATPSRCIVEDDWSRYSTEVSVIEGGTVRKDTAPEPTPEKPKINYPWGDQSHKPFFYGRKFELPNRVEENNKDELVAPIITSPIRALLSGEKETEELRENQNEILSSVRDFLRETTEAAFNETYFSEDVSESENNGGEATTEGIEDVQRQDGEDSVSRSRQDGDRSLMVVLPFKANNEDNIQELFTKSPMIKVIESSDELEKGLGTKTEVGVSGTTYPPNVREREIVPITQTQRPIYKYRRRWLPSRRRTTPEVEGNEAATITESYSAVTTTAEWYSATTTTENMEDSTKTYTNYNNVEMVTKKYESNPTPSVQNITNHKFEQEVTPYPILIAERLKKKTKLREEEEGIKPEATTPTTKSKLKRKGQRRKPTTEGPPKPEDLSKILEILPPDMKDLLLEFGLNKEHKEEKGSEDSFRVERIPQPSIDPMSYAIFKPLPLEPKGENRNFVPDDMKDFLASFGLLPTGNRVQKSLKPQPTEKPADEEFDWGFLPDDLRLMLEDMGLVKNSNKKDSTRIHIFNPSNHTIAQTDEDLEKLNAILTSIKTTVNESQTLTPEMQTEIIDKIRDLNNLRYKSGNLSEINNEIQKIVVNNKVSGSPKSRPARRVTKLVDGPDPLMFSEESLSKNEVKRQDNTTNTSSSSSSASSSASSGDAASSASASASSASEDSTTTTTTTEEAPNIEALKESFGGGETAPDDADIESSLPPKRPNGLYLLLDWNSFLEVGTEDDNRRVNLRFQPKIGDSRNFLPVSVP